MKTTPRTFQLGALQFRVEIVTKEQMADLTGEHDNPPVGPVPPR